MKLVLNNSINTRMNLTCSGFHECQKVGDGYICQLGYYNYLFTKCDVLLITLNKQHFILDPNDVFKNIHFVF